MVSLVRSLPARASLGCHARLVDVVVEYVTSADQAIDHQAFTEMLSHRHEPHDGPSGGVKGARARWLYQRNCSTGRSAPLHPGLPAASRIRTEPRRAPTDRAPPRAGPCRERATERVAGDRVPAHPHQELELSLRHPITHRELTPAERDDPGPEPLARWCARLNVVPRQRC